jgi:hypothetical protein
LALVAAVVVGAAIDPRLTATPLFGSPPAPAGLAAEVLRRPPIIADVEALPEIEPSLKQVQDLRTMAQEQGLQTDSPATSDPSLNRWDRIDRTARRQTSTLDYFLGFAY